MSRRLWTDAAVELLRELYPHTRTRDLVGILDATERQIYSKAGTLGLTKSRPGVTVRPMKTWQLIRTDQMNVDREMPKYECHKKVWALKIAGIVGDQHGGVYFQPAEEGYGKVPLTPEYVAKHKPEVGGYYVVYEDGYKSFSPASAFESGYTRL